MALTSIGSIPDGLGVADVWATTLAGTTLPQVIFGRRAQFDELIYDADLGGFAANWAGSSSLTPDGLGGMTLVLGRRAFSMSGLAVFVGDGAGSDAGAVTMGGDVTGSSSAATVVKVQGKAFAAPVTTGDVPHYDGTGIVWSAPSAGSGDVVGPASAVDSRLAAFDTTTGKLLKDSGYTATSLIAAATYTPPTTAVYQGHSVSNVSVPPTTWTDISTLTTLVDALAVGITRSSGVWTLARAGYYRLSVDLNANIGSGNAALRLRDIVGATTILQQAENPLTSLALPLRLQGIFLATAGMTVRIDALAASGGTWSSSTIDGETTRTAGISFAWLGA